MSPEKQPYPIAMVASLLKVSRSVCLKLIREGSLQAQRTPMGLRVDRMALEGWIDAQIRLAEHEGRSLANEGQKK